MRILAISDVHGSAVALDQVAGMASLFDILLLSGDLTDFGGERDAAELLMHLSAFDGRMALVPGNCDKKGARDLFAERGLSVDGLAKELAGARIAGVGGSPYHTGVTPYERKDGELGRSLASVLEKSGDESLPLVALTHAPPKGSGADRLKGGDAGSQALREALEKFAPPLWLCGHIHESPCAAFVGATLVANPGPLRDGRFAVASLERWKGGAWRAEAELRML